MTDSISLYLAKIETLITFVIYIRVQANYEMDMESFYAETIQSGIKQRIILHQPFNDVARNMKIREIAFLPLTKLLYL